MKPAPFNYVRATGIDDATSALASAGGRAKVLAGGQSLIPMLNFRLVDADLFVDINHIGGLDGIEDSGDGLRIGAITRHHQIETSDAVRRRFPVLAAAMQHVAHLAIRNRGTIGGSLSHADPAAELPAMSLLLDATIETASRSGGRSLAARDFFAGPLANALEDSEIVTSVVLPVLPPGAGWGFDEVARRRGDFAIAGAGCVIALENGAVSEARIALMGVHDTPLRATAAEALLAGNSPDTDAVNAAAAAARDAVEPMNDLHGSADYRRHLAGVVVRRTLDAAVARAREEAR